MKSSVRFLGIALLLLMAACKDNGVSALPKSLEPDSNSIAYFCGMSLLEHEGPKGQIFLRNKDKPIWFASVGEVFAYLNTELAQPHDLLVVYVNDMAKGSWEHPAAGAWVDAHEAFYVVGGSRSAAMGGKEPVPFSSQEAATAFVKEFGGGIVDFTAAAKSMAAQ